MKLAITGKGGVGKTTLASTLARLYADEGRPVLAADVDPDANLGLALGMSQEEVDSIVPISKMRTLVEERTGANEANKFFKLNPFVSDIPEKYAHEVNGVKLLTAKLDGVPVKALRDIMDDVRSRIPSGVACLATVEGEKVGLLFRGPGSEQLEKGDVLTAGTED